MYQLALCCETGHGTAQNYEKAAEWYEKAAMAGDPRSMVRLGVLSEAGNGVPKDESKAVSWYQMAAALGNAEGMTNLAVLLRQGRGTDPDLPEAARLLEAASEQMNPRAMYLNGLLCLEGDEQHPRDERHAFRLFLDAAEAGYEKAWHAVAHCRENGIGTLANPVRAATDYRLAAEYGLPDAQFRYAVLLRLGEVVRQNDEESFRWLSKAAAQGHPDAICELGYYYDKGIAVQKDPIRARHLFEEAASLGCVRAMTNLAQLYAVGRGVEPDEEKAVDLFLQAADAGDPFAMTRIGEMYERGVGVKQKKDLSKALYWYRRASKGGDLVASGALEGMRVMFRDSFRQSLLATLILSGAGLLSLILHLAGVLPTVTGILAGVCLLGDLAVVGRTAPLLKQYFDF